VSSPFKFHNQNFVCNSYLPYACYMSRPTYLPWLDHSNKISWSSSLCSLLPPRTVRRNFTMLYQLGQSPCGPRLATPTPRRSVGTHYFSDGGPRLDSCLFALANVFRAGAGTMQPVTGLFSNGSAAEWWAMPRTVWVCGWVRPCASQVQVKVRVVPVLNQVQRHEGVLESGDIARL
jgi:hypothetical protein